MKENSPAGELGKAPEAYESLIGAMQASLRHGARGLEDQAANELFDKGMLDFEAQFSDAFDSLADWADPEASNSGHVVLLDGRMKQLATMKSFCVVIHSCLTRWSSTMLQENCEGLGDALANSFMLLSAAALWSRS